MTHAAPDRTPMFLPHERLQDMLDALDRAGYLCVGPTLRDSAIVYERLRSAADLPTGASDVQAPGSYRTKASDSRRRWPLLTAAISGVAREDGWAPLSGVGSLVAKSNPSFDPRNYGCQKLGELVRRQRYLEVKSVPATDGSRNAHLYVRIKET